jgi:hypothetical protein
VGDTLGLTATGGPSGSPVTFTTDSPACLVNPAGTEVRLDHVGTCTVVAHQKGNADYNDAPEVTQTVKVAKGEQHIDFVLPGNAKVGDDLPLTATGGPSGKKVTYNGNAACTVNDAGTTLTMRHPGTCSVTAHQAGNDDYNAAPDVTQTVTVARGDQRIAFTSTPPSPALVQGRYVVSATGGASGRPVVFGSATTAVCTVSGSTVTFLKAGACTVTANQEGNGDYDPAPQATQAVTVIPATDLSITAEASEDPPSPDRRWHTVDVTVHDLVAGGHATVSGDSPSNGVVVLPQLNCWFQIGGVCHVTSPPTTTTVQFFVLLPSSVHDAKVTFTVASDDSPDPDPSNDTATVTIKRFDD